MICFRVIGASVTCALCAIVAMALTPARGLALRGQEPPTTEWRAFDGNWSASGSRQTIPTESGRAAAVAHLSGAVVLSNGTGIAAGFTAEAIGFDDGTSATTGRAVWTDSAGDRIFSTFRGGPLQTGNRISASITGGTGRWARVTGDYQLTWQSVVSAESGDLQGRTVDLRGRLRWSDGPK